MIWRYTDHTVRYRKHVSRRVGAGVTSIGVTSITFQSSSQSTQNREFTSNYCSFSAPFHRFTTLTTICYGQTIIYIVRSYFTTLKYMTSPALILVYSYCGLCYHLTSSEFKPFIYDSFVPTFQFAHLPAKLPGGKTKTLNVSVMWHFTHRNVARSLRMRPRSCARHI